MRLTLISFSDKAEGILTGILKEPVARGGSYDFPLPLAQQEGLEDVRVRCPSCKGWGTISYGEGEDTCPYCIGGLAYLYEALSFPVENVLETYQKELRDTD